MIYLIFGELIVIMMTLAPSFPTKGLGHMPMLLCVCGLVIGFWPFFLIAAMAQSIGKE